MKTLEFVFDARLDFSGPVTDHQFTLRCVPANCRSQQLQSLRVTLLPETRLYRLRDGFGNEMLSGTLNGPHTQLHYRAQGTAVTDSRRREKADPGPASAVYRTPGLLTAPSPALRAYAAGLPLNGRSDRQKARLLCTAAGSRLRYAPGTTTNATTAAQAFELCAGVCQDYTHVFLALARLCGLTARYCMGLTLGEGATHAWAEVLLPEGWVGFDPTRGCVAGEGYLRFAVGRDAADCPAERGVFRGNAGQTQTVAMSLRERAGPL